MMMQEGLLTSFMWWEAPLDLTGEKVTRVTFPSLWAAPQPKQNISPQPLQFQGDDGVLTMTANHSHHDSQSQLFQVTNSWLLVHTDQCPSVPGSEEEDHAKGYQL